MCIPFCTLQNFSPKRRSFQSCFSLLGSNIVQYLRDDDAWLTDSETLFILSIGSESIQVDEITYDNALK
jgi:hypothetical protein